MPTAPSLLGRYRFWSILQSIMVIVAVQIVASFILLTVTDLKDYVPIHMLVHFTGILACLCSVMLNVSPIYVIVDAIRTENPDLVQIPLHIVAMTNGVLNIVWGLRTQNIPLMQTGELILAINSVFLSACLELRSRGIVWSAQYVTTMVSCVLCGLFLFSILSTSVVAMFIIMSGVCGACATLAKLETVIRNRDASMLPLSVVGPIIVNNGVWTIFAVLVDDFAIFVQSLAGFVMGIFQIIVIFWCRVETGVFDLTFLLFIFEHGKAKGAVDEEAGQEIKGVTETHAPVQEHLDVPGNMKPCDGG